MCLPACSALARPSGWACCAADRGTTIVTTRARRTATGITRTIATTTSGFVWCVFPPCPSALLLVPVADRNGDSGACARESFRKCRAFTDARPRRRKKDSAGRVWSVRQEAARGTAGVGRIQKLGRGLEGLGLSRRARPSFSGFPAPAPRAQGRANAFAGSIPRAVCRCRRPCGSRADTGPRSAIATAAPGADTGAACSGQRRRLPGAPAVRGPFGRWPRRAPPGNRARRSSDAA